MGPIRVSRHTTVQYEGRGDAFSQPTGPHRLNWGHRYSKSGNPPLPTGGGRVTRPVARVVIRRTVVVQESLRHSWRRHDYRRLGPDPASTSPGARRFGAGDRTLPRPRSWSRTPARRHAHRVHARVRALHVRSDKYQTAFFAFQLNGFIQQQSGVAHTVPGKLEQRRRGFTFRIMCDRATRGVGRSGSPNARANRAAGIRARCGNLKWYSRQNGLFAGRSLRIVSISPGSPSW